MKHKRRAMRAGILLLLLFVTAAWCIWGNTSITTTLIQVRDNRLPQNFDGFRIVQVSDLHNTVFGKNNARFIQALRAFHPSIIVLTGDTIDSNRTDVQTAVNFVCDALDIAPVYFVTGNHEAIAMDAFAQLERAITDMGAVVLRSAAHEIEISGQFIRLIGADDLGFYAKDRPVEAAKDQLGADINALTSYGTYTVLLSHRPELADIYADAQVNVVLCGHAHGGQFRLPFIGGFFAPGQGFFPRYDAGLYPLESANMIVSRGLGNSVIPLRINNRPEIVVAELLC